MERSTCQQRVDACSPTGRYDQLLFTVPDTETQVLETPPHPKRAQFPRPNPNPNSGLLRHMLDDSRQSWAAPFLTSLPILSLSYDSPLYHKQSSSVLPAYGSFSAHFLALQGKHSDSDTLTQGNNACGFTWAGFLACWLPRFQF